MVEQVIPTQRSHFQWSAIFGGVAAAAGTSLTLNAFGAGIGLSVVSGAPTWRDSSAVYWALAGAFLVFVAVTSFCVGGYVAGRMRAPLNLSSPEIEFRDGMHGLATWGATIVLIAIVTLGVAASEHSIATPAHSAAGETLLASELDDLFRTSRLTADLTYRRAEAARILLKVSRHNGVSDDDHRYLSAITGSIAGVPEAEAGQRVNQAINASADALHRARVAAVLEAFFVAAALLVGAVVAWFAAAEGGKDREQSEYHFWDRFGRRRT